MPTSAACMLRAMTSKADRQGRAGRRVTAAILVGAAVTVIALVAGSGWTVALTSGWGAAALLTSAMILLRIRGMDASQTAAIAQAEDYSRATADLVVLSASVASLVAIGFTLVEARHHTGVEKGLLILLAVVVVALSWTTVHLIYTIRYGDLYYGDPVGGVTFNEDDPPDYRDFIYLAFTIGMTYQVSDTNLSSKPIRHAATRHALLSFLFGAVIVALAINSVASLLQ
jgi:uncharacterized membrane protein